MSTSKVAVVTVTVCWALLLLSVLPVRAIADCHAPGPPAASPTRTTTRSQVLMQVVRSSASAAFFQFRYVQKAAGHRKMLRMSGSEDDVKRWSDTATTSTISKGWSMYGGQRLLVGSSPPTCRGKCGSCSPCSPIHVSIGSPRGSVTQQEYYPEVWRCKCGNKLFMP